VVVRDEEISGWVVVNNKNAQFVEPEDFVGEFVFQDDDEYDQYVQNTTIAKKNFKEEVKELWGKASVFGKKTSEKVKTKIAEAHIKDKLKSKGQAVKSFFKKEEQKGPKFTEKVKLGFSKLFKKKVHFTEQRQEILYSEQDQIDDVGVNHGVGRLSGVDDIRIEAST